MSGHDDVGVDAQCLLSMTEVEAFDKDLAWFFAYEYRQSLHDGEGQEVHSVSFYDAIWIHRITSAICWSGDQQGTGSTDVLRGGLLTTAIICWSGDQQGTKEDLTVRGGLLTAALGH